MSVVRQLFFKALTALSSLCLSGPIHAQDICPNWLTRDFFAASSIDEISDCLAGGRSLVERNDIGETPLHLAASAANDAGIVLYLLENGADVSLTSKDGQTALHHAAAETGVAETVVYLVLFGSDPNAPVVGSKWCSSALRKHQRCAVTPLHLASRRPGAGAVISTLLVAGADVSDLDRNERTPLFLAAQNATAKEVGILLQAGADTEVAENQGNTPLHIAIRNKIDSQNIIRMLLEAGADADAQRKDGNTPLILGSYYAKETTSFLQILASASDPCHVSDKEQSAILGIEFNPVLQKDQIYWTLHEQCSK